MSPRIQVNPVTSTPIRLFVLLCSLLALTACAPKTPQQVAESFWKAVIKSDATEAVESSTLSDVRDYDGYAQNWTGFTPAWGKSTVEGDRARVATTLTRATGAGDKTIEFDTLLIRQDGQWKVDYAGTGSEVHGAPFARLFDQLGRLGKSISEQLAESSERLAAEMERMQRELAGISRSAGEQAAEIIEQQAEELRSRLKALAESIRGALEDHEKSLSKRDRQTLREVSDDLERHGEQLSRPTLDAVADGGQSIARANRRLDGIDNAALAPYRGQWLEWSRQTEEDMKRFTAQVSAIGRE